jgi:tRNA 5-methylaminomethyl-2-thiouridine biosynthesis bifunctional protein
MMAATFPWFARPPVLQSRNATVIGGGIAGCQIARSLVERGWQVTLLERHARIASEASGNRAGVLIPKMTAEPSEGETFYRQAFTYAIQQITRMEAAGHTIEWQQCGALQLAHEPREATRQQALKQRHLPESFIQILDAQQASAVGGIPLTVGASYFPQAGWLNPASFCAALVAHEAIEVRTLSEAFQPIVGEVTIIANGREADQWAQTAFLPFMPVAGQTSRAAASADSERLQTTLGHEGYLTPAVAGQHIFGATFARNVREAVLDDSANATNFQQMTQYLPAFAASLSDVESSHAAVRMTTPDRYPIVGAVPDVAFFQQAYADLRYGNPRLIYPPAQYQQGLFISAGYGSRGLATSGLCAELLAAVITGEPLPVADSLYHNLHPARFLIRQLKRG